MLCGGLGSSPFVVNKFKQYIDDELNGKMQLVSPDRSWSATVRGAVISNLGKSPVIYRRCKDHIGVCVHEQFEAERHKPADRFECPILGPRAKNQMSWHVSRVSCRIWASMDMLIVHQGERMSASLKKSFDCYVVVEGTNVSKAKQQYLVYQDLYRCAKKTAPTSMNASGNQIITMVRADLLTRVVSKIGRIEIDLTKAVRSERNRIKADKGKYPDKVDINVSLEMTLGADKGVLEISAKDGKKKFGSAKIEYDANPAYKGVLVSGDD